MEHNILFERAKYIYFILDGLKLYLFIAEDDDGLDCTLNEARVDNKTKPYAHILMLLAGTSCFRKGEYKLLENFYRAVTG